MEKKIILPDCLKDQYLFELNDLLNTYKMICDRSLPADIDEGADSIFKQHYIKGEEFDGLVESWKYQNRWKRSSRLILVAWITISYEMWEQQVIQWICWMIEALNLKNEGINHPNSLETAKKVLKYIDADFDITGLQSYDRIDTMRLCVNTIKHGEGRSAKELYEKHPEMFVQERDGIAYLHQNSKLEIHRQHTSISAETLIVSDKLYYSFTKAVIQFWQELWSLVDTVI